MWLSPLITEEEVLKKQGKIKSDSDMPLAIDDFEAKLVEEVI